MNKEIEKVQEIISNAQEKIKEAQEQLKALEAKQQGKIEWEGLKITNGYYISDFCNILRVSSTSLDGFDRNINPTKEDCEADLAMCQLRQLRDAYNGEPLDDWCDWTDEHQDKYVICNSRNVIESRIVWTTRHELAFKTEEIENRFLEHHKELIKIALRCKE